VAFPSGPGILSIGLLMTVKGVICETEQKKYIGNKTHEINLYDQHRAKLISFNKTGISPVDRF
jgi:hypothetical protein